MKNLKITDLSSNQSQEKTEENFLENLSTEEQKNVTGGYAYFVIRGNPSAGQNNPSNNGFYEKNWCGCNRW